MGLTKEFMVAELKKLGYKNIKIQGGEAPLESAPQGNIYYMYMRVTGSKKKSVEQVKKENQLKGV